MSSDARPPYAFPVFSAKPHPSAAAPLSEAFDAHGPGKAAGRRSNADHDPRDTQKRIEAMEKEAYEKAFALGEKAGRELGEATVAPLVEKLSVALDEIAALRATLLRESERELVELALRIARAVLGVETSIRPEAVLENVRRGLRKIEDKGKVILRVHPSDVETVWRSRAALAPFLEGRGDLRVEPDEALERGGCLAVTDFAEADATIEGQIDELREILLKIVEEHE